MQACERQVFWRSARQAATHAERVRSCPQLRDALTKNAVRVIDLFREWDDDNSGSVSRHEFAKAMAALGYDGQPEDIDCVYDSLDPDGSGSLEYKEMNALLKRSVEICPALKPGAAGEIMLESKNKVALRKGKLDSNDSNLLQGLDLDEASDKSVAEQVSLDALSICGPTCLPVRLA